MLIQDKFSQDDCITIARGVSENSKTPKKVLKRQEKDIKGFYHRQYKEA